MSNYVFKTNQRYAVYKAFDGRCQWCKEPVDFKTFHVDHVLPEELLNDPDKHKAILETYGLPADFNINDYENWIPSHSYCNQGKSAKVYEGLGIIKTILDSCAKNKELEQRIELKLNREPKKTELLVTVQTAIERNLVNLADLQNFLLKTDIMESHDEEFKKIGQTLEEKLEYQTEKMVKGIMDTLSAQTWDILKSISSALGSDWQVGSPLMSVRKPVDTKYIIRFGINNKINSSLSVRIVINPDVIDNMLIITFRDDDGDFDRLEYDIRTGVDWENYRAVLREHYKARLIKK